MSASMNRPTLLMPVVVNLVLGLWRGGRWYYPLQPVRRAAVSQLESRTPGSQTPRWFSPDPAPVSPYLLST